MILLAISSATSLIQSHFNFFPDPIQSNPIQSNNSQVKKPSLATTREDGTTTNIYLQGPKSLEEATRPNLDKKVSEFVEEGGGIVVTATSLPLSLSLAIKYV